MTDPDHCASCGAPIIWIKDQDGTKLPLNKTRVRMYVTADENGPSRYLRKHKGKPEPFLAHVSHFTTCPNAGGHSSPQRRMN